MAQFTVYKNKNPKSKADVPYLLSVQTDLLDELASRVVIPLYSKKASGLKSFTKLTPELVVEGKKYVAMTPQLAGISVKDLGEPVTELSKHRLEIISAIDLLITGF